MNMIVQQLPKEIFQCRDANPVLRKTASGCCLEELLFLEMALLNRNTLLDFLGGPIFHRKPSVIETLYRVLGDVQYL